MGEEIGKICAEGFSFFGMTNRLISHELKNILAIISETLGLTNELLELSETGRELKPGKLRSLSESIIEEVERANAIIKNMNTLAHSLDEIIREVDIRQTLILMIGLSQLESDLRNNKLHLLDGESCIIYTSPFFLGILISRVINLSLRNAGSENEIRVSLDSDDNAVRITFSGIASNISGQLLTEKEDVLAKLLSAKVSFDVSAHNLKIELPERIGESLIQNLFT